MGWIADLLREIPSAARYKFELEAMEAKVAALEKENANLKSEIAELRQEIQRRDDVVQKKKSHDQNLEEIAEGILAALSQHGELDTEQLARRLGIGAQLAVFHLHELQQKKMVMDYHAVGSPVYWGLIQGGRAYLVRRGLLA